MTWEDTHTHKHTCTHAHIVINSRFAPPCHAIQNTVHIGFWAFDNVVSFVYFIYICVPSMIYKERTYILISSVFICIHIHINSYYNILMQTSVGEPLSILAVPPGQEGGRNGQRVPPHLLVWQLPKAANQAYVWLQDDGHQATLLPWSLLTPVNLTTTTTTSYQ